MRRETDSLSALVAAAICLFFVFFPGKNQKATTIKFQRKIQSAKKTSLSAMLMLSSCRDSHQPAASQYTRNQGRTNISAPSQIQIHKYILLCTILQPQLQISTIWYCLYLRWRLRVGLTLFTTLFIASWSCTVHFLLLRGSGKREGGVGGKGLLKGPCSGRSISLCLVFEDHWCSCNLDPR